MPMTTAVASPRLMASTAIFAATPKDAHAATGANAGPLILPIIEICAAGMLAMFHRRLGDTAAHGSSGQSHFRLSARILLSFCRIEDSFAEPDGGGPGWPWMARASFRYSRSASLRSAQYRCQSCFVSIHISDPTSRVEGSAGA